MKLCLRYLTYMIRTSYLWHFRYVSVITLNFYAVVATDRQRPDAGIVNITPLLRNH
jgi:hypothetical protein